MAALAIESSAETFLPGESYLSDTPALRMHAGTQPDLLLRWNAVPIAAARIDAVVHLHGFSQQRDRMPLAEKAARSGLDLSRRKRPTLALLPRGNWMRYTWYDFPALLDGGIDRLVDYALDRFGGGRRLTVDRLILTAHSGGGMPAVDALRGMGRPPDELHIFDGLYGRDPATDDPLRGLAAIDDWLAGRFAQEPERPGALRVVYIERQTGPFSRAVGGLIARRLAAADPAITADLARRYRVEASRVPHGYIAAVCGPVLLAQPDAEFDWPRIA